MGIKKYASIFLLIVAVGCKSKGDWRVRYQEQKRAEKFQKTQRKYSTNGEIKNKTSTELIQEWVQNPHLQLEIAKWYGVPYKFGGQSMQGVDCSGFVQSVYREVYQTELPRTSASMAQQISAKKISLLKEGDLVFFSFGKSSKVNHVGIYLRDGKFVHSSTSKGVIISDLSESYYAKNLVKSGVVKVN